MANDDGPRDAERGQQRVGVGLLVLGGAYPLVTFMRGGGSIAPEQNPEHKPVRDEKQRNDESRNEVRGLQHTRRQAGSIALIEGVEKIGSAPQVEYPDQI